MSALTKVFVVLQVVLSLLLSAGLVVFVNKVEDYRVATTKAQEETRRERAAKEAATAETAAVRGERDRDVQVAEVRATASEQALNASLAQVTALSTQLEQAKATADKASVDLANSVLAMKAAQESYQAAEGTIQELRKSGDDLQKKYAESMLAISDTTNQLDVLKGRYRKSLEEITDLTQQNKDIRERGHAVPNLPQPGGVGAAVPLVGEAANLKGVVRDTKDIQGVRYATISLGSSDQVAKGMQFKVLDRVANQFLGYLTIDRVDYAESTGHLSGPSPALVKKGVEVVTQLQ